MTQPSWFAVYDLAHPQHKAGLVVGTHHEICCTIKEHNMAAVDVADLAEQRLLLGKYHQVAWTGSRTTDLLLVNKDRMWFAHGNPDSELWTETGSRIYEQHNAQGQEIVFDTTFLADDKSLIEIDPDGFEIETEKLPDHPVGQFLFGDLVSVYAQWLLDANIFYFPVSLPSKSLTRWHPGPFVRPLIMRCTDNWSGIITAHADLHLPYGVRTTVDHNWAGTVEPEETFGPKKLEPFITLLDIQNRKSYTLSELEKAVTKTNNPLVLGTILRVLRGGSDLPANYNTFSSTTI